MKFIKVICPLNFCVFVITTNIELNVCQLMLFMDCEPEIKISWYSINQSIILFADTTVSQ